MGLVVPKLGHRIVDRNRLKRRLREIGRTALLPGLRRQGRHLDVLIRIRRAAYLAAYAELELAILTGVEAACSEV